MFGVDGNQYVGGKRTRQYQRRAGPGGGQQVVSLVDHNPMRPCGRDAQLGKKRQQLGKKAGPVGEIDPEEVDHDVLLGIAEKLDNLGKAW